MLNSKNVTFIIPVFKLEEYRLSNLKFVLNYIIETKCEVIVVEQRKESDPGIKNIIEEISNKNENSKIKYVSYISQLDVINKSAIINFAVKNHVNTEYFWMNDVDFYMKFDRVFNTETSCDFIQPYSSAKKLSDDDSIKIKNGNRIEVSYSDPVADYISMYGALSFIANKKTFEQIGGMDETLIGWGKEDMNLRDRLSKMRKGVQVLDNKGIHFWHPIGIESMDVSLFDVNSYFDKIYCINLERRLDKWIKVKKEFDKYKLNVSRFSAIDGNDLRCEVESAGSVEEMSAQGLIENKNALGCLLSHLNVIQDAKLNGYKRILVFEDDVFLCKNFLSEIKRIQEIDWKLLYLGCSQFNWKEIKVCKGCYLSNDSYGTFAYALNIDAYDEIISMLNSRKKSVDNLMIDFQSKNVGVCYTIYPNIVVSDVTGSDIRRKQNMEDYAFMVRWNLEDFYIPKIENKINTANGIQNLIDLDRVFRKNGVEYWISCGTLLGFHREGSFISHDTDIDICVNIEYLSEKMLLDIFKTGFDFVKVFGTIEDGLEIAIRKNGIKVDLFFFYKKEKYWYHSVYSDFTAHDCLKHDYIFSPFELVEKEYLGHKFFVPSNTDAYLSEQYGKNFWKKSEEWKYYSSPKNIVHTDKRILFEKTVLDFEKIAHGEINKRVTLLIKSFGRKECVDLLIRSIRKLYRLIKIVVVDDSNPPMNFDYDENIKTYNIEFDSGLSAGRNYGVSKIETDYFILLDDDFEFTSNTNLVRWYHIFIKSNLDILGGDVVENGARSRYIANLERVGDCLTFKDARYNVYEDYSTCDLVLNFFIAKTNSIKLHKWDSELKLCEHTAFFVEHKGKLKVGHTNNISIIHKKVRAPEYNIYRSRSKEFQLNWMVNQKVNKIVNFYSVAKVENNKVITSTMSINKSYWDKFYRSEKAPTNESEFAKFTLTYIKNNKIKGKMVDIGCGNGRDLNFFIENKIDAVGIDQSVAGNIKNVIKENMIFFDYSPYNILYLRFVLHTIREEELDYLLERIRETTKSCIVFIETRSIFGIASGDAVETSFRSPVGSAHFRMLYSESYLTNKLNEHFNILYKKEGKNLALYKNENPVCIRYVLSKK